MIACTRVVNIELTTRHGDEVTGELVTVIELRQTDLTATLRVGPETAVTIDEPGLTHMEPHLAVNPARPTASP